MKPHDNTFNEVQMNHLITFEFSLCYFSIFSSSFCAEFVVVSVSRNAVDLVMLELEIKKCFVKNQSAITDDGGDHFDY